LSDILGSDVDSVNTGLEHEDERNTLLSIVSTLNDREQTIMRLRFGIGSEREHTQKEVAEMLGISQSYISRLEKRIIEHIKIEMETVLN
jgi:RNA polymerase sporulation-specific sigma factor